MMKVFALLALLAFLGSCDKSEIGGPLDYLEVCTPGRSTFECVRKLKKAPENMFPAGRLEGIDFHLETIQAMRGGMPVTDAPEDYVFVYSLKFNVGRDDIEQALTTALGAKLGRGVAPVHTFTTHSGDFWQTDEGFWICGERTVTWLSNPFRRDDQHILIEGYRDVDHFVHPVPHTAGLWARLGRELIGLDVGHRLKL